MPVLMLSLLGPPRIERDGVCIHIPRRKAVALLAYLAVSRQMHRRDALATLFWPEHDQSSARAGLRRALSALKEGLGGGWVDAERETVTLRGDAEIETDVHAFRQRLAGCPEHAHAAQATCPACRPLLGEAAALYRGDFMAGFSLLDSPGFDDWQFFQAQGLRDGLAGALERLVEGHSACGEFDLAIGYARRWVALDPLHEPAQRWLMRLYAWTGQRAAALRQYEECVRILQDELGVPPAQETVALHQAVVEQRELPCPEKVGVPGETEGGVPPRHNLPAQVTPFVGREALLAQIGQRLADPDCRLLTLVGPGGSGKTRLAVEAAREVAAEFADGTYLVSLAPVGSLEGVAPAVAAAIGFRLHGAAEPAQQVAGYLRRRRVLLVLDNMEHLTEGGGLVANLLQKAPGVKVLVTSRARLNVGGEHLYTLAGLQYPVQDQSGRQADREDLREYGAVQLFLNSAARVRPDHSWSAEELAQIGAICALVEGMPLAILLAAAWVEVLSLGEIAAQVRQGLDILEGDMRDLPERQRSMRATFDLSWRLLSAQEHAQAFARLSVFRGGFTAEAARAVAGADARTLRELAHKSFVQRGAEGRWHVHELLRQYGEERLGEVPGEPEGSAERHCVYYVELLRHTGDGVRRGYTQETLPEIDNIRAAWRWAVSHGRVQELASSLESLMWLYQYAGWFQEGEAVLGEAAKALWTREPARDERVVLAHLLVFQAVFAHFLGRLELATQLVQQGLSVVRQWGTPAQVAWAVIWGTFYGDLKHDPQIEPRAQEALAILTQANDLQGMIRSHQLLSVLAVRHKAYDQAEAHCRDTLQVSRRQDNRRVIASVRMTMGHIARGRGQYAEAQELYEQSLELWQEIGHSTMVAEQYEYLGHTALAHGEYQEAEGRYRQALASFQELGIYWSESVSGECHGIGLCLAWLGDVALARGDGEQAAYHYRQALEVAAERPYPALKLELVVRLAALSARAGQAERAAALAALALAHPAGLEEIQDKARRVLDGLAGQLSPAGLLAAQERGRALDLEATVAELLAEFSSPS